jgi:hypothetical protein
MKFAPLLALLSLCLPSAVPGQAAAPAATTQGAKDAAAKDKAAKDSAAKMVKAVTEGAKQGAPLTTLSNVSESLNVEAVMLPGPIVKRVFGEEVAKNYAVIEVNIANRSNEAGFVLQSLFIDFSNWALGNALGMNMDYHLPKPYQSRGSAQQVSSVEYRIVRGEMLDAQPWTARNQLVRSAKVLGSIGTAFAFPFSRDVVSGINAWNGGVVPGLDALFPDGTDAQINRISDYGFRDNKIVPQQSSDIVIAFFPIDRFLSPSLRKLFLKSPSLFFNPILLAIDPASAKGIEPILENAMGTEDKGMVKKALGELLGGVAHLDPDESARLTADVQNKQDAVAEARMQRDEAQAVRDAKEVEVAKDTKANKKPDAKGEADAVQKFNAAEARYGTAQAELATARAALATFLQPLQTVPLYNILKSMSLSNVHVTVSGIMTVDETIVPASIEDSCFNHPEASDPGDVGDMKKCFLRGRFLNGGIPSISVIKGTDPGISNVTVDTASSSADILNFTYSQKDPLSDATLQIVVTKPGKSGKSVDSMKYLVDVSSLFGPTISGVTADSSQNVVVAGSNFFTGKTSPLVVKLHSTTGTSDTTSDPTVVPVTVTSGTITLSAASITALKLAMGCYQVDVETAFAKALSTKDKVVNQNGAVTCP